MSPICAGGEERSGSIRFYWRNTITIDAVFGVQDNASSATWNRGDSRHTESAGCRVDSPASQMGTSNNDEFFVGSIAGAA